MQDAYLVMQIMDWIVTHKKLSGEFIRNIRSVLVAGEYFVVRNSECPFDLLCRHTKLHVYNRVTQLSSPPAEIVIIMDLFMKTVRIRSPKAVLNLQTKVLNLWTKKKQKTTKQERMRVLRRGTRNHLENFVRPTDSRSASVAESRVVRR